MITRLETAGLGTFGTDLFAGGLPSEPIECCALVEYGGEPPLRNQTDGAAHQSAQGGERPRFQLMCRSADYETGRNLIQQMWADLDGIVNETLSGIFYQRVAALQSPFLLERDQNNRWIFIANFVATKEVETP
jgi:hypothetical protein